MLPLMRFPLIKVCAQDILFTGYLPKSLAGLCPTGASQACGWHDGAKSDYYPAALTMAEASTSPLKQGPLHQVNPLFWHQWLHGLALNNAAHTLLNLVLL